MDPKDSVIMRLACTLDLIQILLNTFKSLTATVWTVPLMVVLNCHRFVYKIIWPPDYKTFFTLNSAETEV